jgi:hypothetical protein
VRRVAAVENDTVVVVLTIGDLAIERDEQTVLASMSAAPPNS